MLGNLAVGASYGHSSKVYIGSVDRPLALHHAPSNFL